jgi:hypothetical protein
MASQVAHIVYAKKYFEKVSDHGIINKDKFLLGCVFPDIRRIDENIKRKDTHLRFSPIDLNFEGMDNFQSGWKFHLYCDMRREEILNNYNFYSLENTTEFAGQSAKMLEDEIIYDNYNNWEKIASYFNSPPEINNGIGVTRKTLELWYAILAKYIEKKPDSRSIKIFLSKSFSTAQNSSVIAGTVDELRKNGKVIEILKKVKEEIV